MGGLPIRLKQVIKFGHVEHVAWLILHALKSHVLAFFTREEQGL